MKKILKKRNPAANKAHAKKKMPLYQIEGIKIYNALEKIRRPLGIKDAVKYLHANR